jgi:hypothetical protein
VVDEIKSQLLCVPSFPSCTHTSRIASVLCRKHFVSAQFGILHL